MSYFQTEEPLVVFCTTLFGIVQVFIIMGAIGLLVIRSRLRKGRSLVNYSFPIQTLHFFCVLCSRVLLQVCSGTLAYLIKCWCSNDDFPDIKNLTRVFYGKEVGLYISFTFLLVTFIEVAALSISEITFCHDLSLLKRTFWSATSWHAPLFWLLFHIFIPIEFIVISSVHNIIKQCVD